MQLRVQFPSGRPVYGPVGNVTYEGDTVKISGKALGQTEEPSPCLPTVVGTIVQNSAGDPDVYSFTDIKNVTIERNFNPVKGVLPWSSSDKYTIARLYKAVKQIPRTEGGLKYRLKYRPLFERQTGGRFFCLLFP